MEFQYGLDAFYEGGPKTWQEAFPPVCVKSHWDPTQVTNYVLPAQLVAPQQYDPRQSVRICTSYYTTADPDVSAGPPQDAEVRVQRASASLKNAFQEQSEPPIPASLLGPDYYRRNSPPTDVAFGGAAGLGAPYALYAESVNQESDLYRLNTPLTKCKERRYQPQGGPADATNTLPHVSQSFGLSPHATVVAKSTGCRQADDEAAWNRSARLFFNPTRMDRVYPQTHGPLACGKKV